MICANPKCGKEFESQNPQRVYCSRTCNKAVSNAKRCRKDDEKAKAYRQTWNSRNKQRKIIADREYRKTNKDAVKAQTRIRIKRHTKELSDWYVRMLLRRTPTTDKSTIELKREQIKLKRKVYEIERIINNR